MARGSCVLRGRLDWAIAITIAFLVLVNVIDIRVKNASLILGPAGAAGLLALARWAGLSWAGLSSAWAGERGGVGCAGRSLRSVPSRCCSRWPPWSR